jgi:hypothetical protein
MAIAQYPEDFYASYEHVESDVRIHEINRELPSVNTYDPKAIDIAAMLVWLDKKYGVDDDENLIVFELIQDSPGLWSLSNFYINVTFCDPVKALAAQQLNQAWNDMQSRQFNEVEREYRFRLPEAILYDTDSEVLFAWPDFHVDPRRPRYATPEVLANTKRTVRVTRVPRESMVDVAHTARPDGTRVHIP